MRPTLVAYGVSHDRLHPGSIKRVHGEHVRVQAFTGKQRDAVKHDGTQCGIVGAQNEKSG